VLLSISVGTKINFRENFSQVQMKFIFVFREQNCGYAIPNFAKRLFVHKYENYAFRENKINTKNRNLPCCENKFYFYIYIYGEAQI
jgi:hypothetical protein